MQEPERIQPETLGDYLEIMSKAVFQSGISWKVVGAKWPGIKEAFQGFDAETVADLAEPDIEALVQDTRVIRNRRKLEAIVYNAHRMLELDEQFGEFQRYIRSHGDFQSTLQDIRKQFKFMGDTGTYYFLHVVGEDVPTHGELVESRISKPR